MSIFGAKMLDFVSCKFQATSKNSFLRIWARDFGSTKVSESPEYFVYWGLFEMNCWAEISGQIAKGVFLEVPFSLSHSAKNTNHAVILSEVEQIRKNLRNEVEGSTHLRDILGQIGAKIPRLRCAPLGMTTAPVQLHDKF